MSRKKLRLRLFKDEAEFDICCGSHRKIFLERNARYGGAFHETGVLGSVVELTAIAARFRSLVILPCDHGREFKEDILNACADLHNYANMVRILIEEDNWEGKDEDEK